MKGLDGNKMGKSFNNDIKISDDEETTLKKIRTGITDRNRIRKDDKGDPSNCEVIYDYWKIFGTNEEVEEICSGWKNATMGCMECKKRLGQKVNNYFKPIREKRKELENNDALIKEILYDGSKKARIKAQETIKGVEEAVRMFK